MKKLDVSSAMKTAKTVITANSPVLLVGTAVAGVVATGILAARAGYKARGILEEAQAKQVEPLTRQDQFKLTWLCYAAPALTATSTIASVIGVHTIHSKRHAALTGLYALAATRFDDYRAQAEEMLGVKKSQTLNETVMQTEATRRGFENNEVIITPDGGDLCYDQWSGRTFLSSVNKIEAALLSANKVIAQEGEISLNDFYDFLGLPPIDMGSTFGWNGQDVEGRFGTVTAANGKPAVSFYFQHEPKANLGRRR